MSHDVSRPSEESIERAKAGYRSSMGRLFQEHTSFLLGVIHKLMGKELARTLEATDVLQETLLTATAKFDEFYGSDERELRTWLAALAKRKLIDLARHNGRIKRALKGRVSLDEPRTPDGDSLADALPSDTCTASQVVSGREIIGRLAEAMQEIDPGEAEVLRMRYSEGMSFEAIGQVIGTGRNGVRGIVARGLRSLRRIMPPV